MKISKHFSYKEALYLPTWKRAAKKEDGLTPDILSNLKNLFAKMDLVREYFNAPVAVHVAYRPDEYNRLVGGAKNSSHLYGMACDFHVSGVSCDEVRARILKDNKLEEWGMRMEDLPGSKWVHLDIRAPSPSRFFKP